MKHIKLYEEFVDEGLMNTLGKIAKFTLVLPKVMQYVGFASAALGKQFGNEKAKEIAQFLVQHGTTLDNQYKSVVANAIGPFLKDPSKKEQVAKDYIYYLTAKHVGSGFADKNKMRTDPHKSMMNVLGSVDSANIVTNAKQMFPHLLK
jgi:hypothetical protein